MEKVTKFDINAAFKALDEIEIPAATDKKRASGKKLNEGIGRPHINTTSLIEDYYDINSKEDLEAAKSSREDEIAKAKLARIEKIVDLDAESPEDLQPSYVGKTIIQCPQCMTLFYKNQEDLAPSEEDPNVVNVNEPCQHCGNISGYDVIGKVAEVEESERAEFELTPTEGNELDIEFEEPAAETGAEAEEQPVEPVAEVEETEKTEAEEKTEEPESEETEEKAEEEDEEEKKEEAFRANSGNILAEQIKNALKEGVKHTYDWLDQEYIDDCAEILKNEKNLRADSKEYYEFIVSRNEKFESLITKVQNILETDYPEIVENIYNSDGSLGVIEKLYDAFIENNNITVDEAVKNITKAYTINEIEALKDEIKAEEEAIRSARTNSIKNVHVDSLTALKDALDKAIQEEEKKEEAAIRDLPTAEEAAEDMTKNEALKEAKYNAKLTVNDTWEVNNIEAKDEDEAIDIAQEKIDNGEEDNYFETNSGIDITKVEEALKEDTEKFPDPTEHKLIDTVAGVKIYRCKNCGKYGAKINGKVVKKGSIEEIKSAINKVKNADAISESVEYKECQPGQGCLAKLRKQFPNAHVINAKLSSADDIKAIPDGVKTVIVDEFDRQKDPKIIDAIKKLGDKCRVICIVKNAPVLSDTKTDFFKLSNAEADKEISKGSYKESVCTICGKDVDEPCETEDEAKTCINNIEEAQCKIHKAITHDDETMKELNESSAKAALDAFVANLDREASEVNEAAHILDKKAFLQRAREVGSLAKKESCGIREAADDGKLGYSDKDVINMLNDFIKEDSVKALESIEDIHDAAIEECVNKSLTEVYENVDSFKLTGCELTKEGLAVCGDIKFKSGKTRPTKYLFSEAKKNGREITLTGINESLAKSGKFAVKGILEADGTILMAESMSYSYKIGDSLVEGLAKKAID